MVAFEDTFNRDGPIGGTRGWLDAAGTLQRIPPATDGIETTYAGQPLYSDLTETSTPGGTGGVGWAKGRDVFPTAAWKGTSGVLADGKNYSYSVEHNSTRTFIEPDTGTDYSSGVIVYASADSTTGAHVEWDVGGTRYGRRTTVGSAFKVQLSVNDLPALTSEPYIVLLSTIDGAEIDRFRFPHTGKRPAENHFWGATGAAGVVQPNMGSDSGLWVAELDCFVRSNDAWGDCYIVLAGNTTNGAWPDTTCGIELGFDVGGYANIGFYRADGSWVNQGSVNANSVEDSSIVWPQPWPYDAPGTLFKFKITVNPTTGVCKFSVNGADNGGCTIPAAEMTRIRERYADRSARYVGFGNFPFIFEEIQGSFVMTRFKTYLDPPISGAAAPGRAVFVAPVF